MKLIRLLTCLACLLPWLGPLNLLADGKPTVREELWTHPLRIGKNIDSSPAIAADGTIYTTVSGPVNYADTASGKLAAVTPDKEVKWIFRTRSESQSSPALAADGTIYFGCRDRRLYAVNPDGTEKWRVETGSWVDASPAIGANGTIYAGSWDGKFYSISPEGKTNWTLSTGGPIESSAAIDAGGTIYFGSHDTNFYAMNPDGSVKWKFPTGGAIISSPAIDEDGTIYITSVDGKLYAITPDGREKWHLATGGYHRGSPTISGKGTILLAVNNLFYGITRAGVKKWYFAYPIMEGAGTATADGSVIFLAMNDGVGSVYEFDADEGTRISTTGIHEDVTSSVTIRPDGVIIFGGNMLHAMKGTSPLAHSSWPKFRGGLRQTGRVGDE